MAINIVPEQYGILAQQPQVQPAAQTEQPGLLSSLGGMFSGEGMGNMTPQQQMMLSLGAGMLANSRKRPGEAFGAAVPQAMQQQMLAQKMFSEDEEKKRREKVRQQLGAWYSNPDVQRSMGISSELQPYMTTMAQNAPEMIPDLLKGLNRGAGEFTALTPEQVAAAGLPPGTVVYKGAEGWNVKMPSAGTTVNVGGENYSPGDKELDKAFVKETYLPFKSGGVATSGAQIATLRGVMQDIADGKPVSGPGQGVVQALGGDTAQAIFNPEARDAQERVASVVQTTLRETLGGQFAMLEGTQLINRAFNPALPPEMNARRVAQLLAKTEAMYNAKKAMVDYYDKNRTLSGYTGTMADVQDFIALDQQWAAEDAKLGGDNAQQGVPQDEGALGGFGDYMKGLFGGNP